MGTKSNIAIERTNEAVDVIQCQYDGYPSYNGAMLLKHYNTPERVRELIKLGDISYLAENPAPTGKHSYDKHQAGVTLAYGRDRGEQGTEALKFDSLADYARTLKQPRTYLQVEYAYLYRENESAWYWMPVPENGHVQEFQLLTQRDALIA